MSFADYAKRTIPRAYNTFKAKTNNKPFDITTDLKPGDIIRWNNVRTGTFLRYEIEPGYGHCIWYLRPNFVDSQLNEGFDQTHCFTLVSRA